MEARTEAKESLASLNNNGKDPVKEIENDREFRAHIYQQLVELQPYLSPDSQVSVLVQLEQSEDEDGEIETDYTLSLVATMGEYRLEAEGTDNDMYGALGLAKQNMIQRLEEVYSSCIDSTERDEEIDSLLVGGQTLH